MGARPFLRSLRASADTPTTSRSPSAAARSRARRCPTWKTSNVPKVITVRGMRGILARSGRMTGMAASSATSSARSTTSPPPSPPPISLITPDPGADEARRRGLRRMRTVAVGLLVLAACVYAATLGRDGFWGFVNAGAEASMVGAIADWFEITARFKHPLGLPRPHPALVTKRQDDTGRGRAEAG